MPGHAVSEMQSRARAQTWGSSNISTPLVMTGSHISMSREVCPHLSPDPLLSRAPSIPHPVVGAGDVRRACGPRVWDHHSGAGTPAALGRLPVTSAPPIAILSTSHHLGLQ